jgi:hypothetical protein
MEMGAEAVAESGFVTSVERINTVWLTLLQPDRLTISSFHCHFKRLDHGSSHPTKPLRALAGTPTARDDTVCSLMCFVLGEPIRPFSLSIGFTIECQTTNCING